MTKVLWMDDHRPISPRLREELERAHPGIEFLDPVTMVPEPRPRIDVEALLKAFALEPEDLAVPPGVQELASAMAAHLRYEDALHRTLEPLRKITNELFERMAARPWFRLTFRPPPRKLKFGRGGRRKRKARARSEARHASARAAWLRECERRLHQVIPTPYDALRIVYPPEEGG